MTDKASLFKISGLPDSFASVVLIFSFILLLSPYFSGADFGVFKIPIFTPSAKKWLKMIGPLLFVLCILFFLPIVPTDNSGRAPVTPTPTLTAIISPTPTPPSTDAPTPTLTPSPLPAKPEPTPTPAPKEIEVPGGVLQGSALKKIQPGYPPMARAAGAQGAVRVEVTISEEGRVIDARVVSGHPLLHEAALQAARQWVFKPTKLSGAPVKTVSILTFNFTL